MLELFGIKLEYKVLTCPGQDMLFISFFYYPEHRYAVFWSRYCDMLLSFLSRNREFIPPTAGRQPTTISFLWELSQPCSVSYLLPTVACKKQSELKYEDSASSVWLGLIVNGIDLSLCWDWKASHLVSQPTTIPSTLCKCWSQEHSLINFLGSSLHLIICFPDNLTCIICKYLFPPFPQ